MLRGISNLISKAFNTPKTLAAAQNDAQASLLDCLGEAAILLDAQKQILHINPSAAAIFPLAQAGQSIQDGINDAGITHLVQQTMQGETVQAVEYNHGKAPPRHFQVMAYLVESHNNSKADDRAVLIFHDHTASIREAALRVEFLANAAHELKTPVASLLGYIETLRGHAKADPEAQALFLGIMQQQAERMQRLINDILSLRRIEISEHDAPTQAADLFLATRAAMEASDPIAAKHKVALKYTGPEEALVRGDQDELTQLVLNLLDNAIAVSDSRANIHIDIEALPNLSGLKANDMMETHNISGSHIRKIVELDSQDTGFAALTLKDNGPGFTYEHLERVGERFYKVNTSKQTKTNGTGLGLAIVKHIMRRHRGGLWAESKPGGGTIFTVMLPIPKTDK